jgi:hypothetical protein
MGAGSLWLSGGAPYRGVSFVICRAFSNKPNVCIHSFQRHPMSITPKKIHKLIIGLGLYVPVSTTSWALTLHMKPRWKFLRVKGVGVLWSIIYPQQANPWMISLKCIWLILNLFKSSKLTNDHFLKVWKFWKKLWFGSHPYDAKININNVLSHI